MYILRLDLDSCKYWSFAILLIIIALVAYHYHYKNNAVKKEEVVLDTKDKPLEGFKNIEINLPPMLDSSCIIVLRPVEFEDKNWQLCDGGELKALDDQVVYKMVNGNLVEIKTPNLLGKLSMDQFNFAKGDSPYYSKIQYFMKKPVLGGKTNPIK